MSKSPFDEVAAKLREQVALGLNIKQAAKKLGLNYGTCLVVSQLAGIGTARRFSDEDTLKFCTLKTKRYNFRVTRLDGVRMPVAEREALQLVIRMFESVLNDCAAVHAPEQPGRDD